MIASKGSSRLARINAEIAQQFSLYALKELDDPIIKFIQITRVEVSKDLSSAKMYYLTLNPSVDRKKLAHCLKEIAPQFRHYLAQQINLRMTPECRFYFDDQAEKTQHVLDLLAKI